MACGPSVGTVTGVRGYRRVGVKVGAGVAVTRRVAVGEDAAVDRGVAVGVAVKRAVDGMVDWMVDVRVRAVITEGEGLSVAGDVNVPQPANRNMAARYRL